MVGDTERKMECNKRKERCVRWEERFSGRGMQAVKWGRCVDEAKKKKREFREPAVKINVWCTVRCPTDVLLLLTRLGFTLCVSVEHPQLLLVRLIIELWQIKHKVFCLLFIHLLFLLFLCWCEMSHLQRLGRAVPPVVAAGDGSTTGCEVVRLASARLHQETDRGSWQPIEREGIGFKEGKREWECVSGWWKH